MELLFFEGTCGEPFAVADLHKSDIKPSFDRTMINVRSDSAKFLRHDGRIYRETDGFAVMKGDIIVVW